MNRCYRASFKTPIFRWCLAAWMAFAVAATAQDSLRHSGKWSEEMLWPSVQHDQKVIRHAAYAFVYSEEHEQAKWIAYELTEEETRGPEERASGFYEDPLVTSGSAADADYAGSGYDRGHLAPAGDMTWSSTAMTESFYYSNMSPQQPSFNRGIWKKLETLVRAWGQEYGSIFIVTGPVLEPGLPVIGPNQVSVPAQYYKVVFRQNGNQGHLISFLMPNAASSEPLTSFAVTVDEIEHRTGLDFFHFLPDEWEDKLESVIVLDEWNWSATGSGRTETIGTVPRPDEHKDISMQCSGITKAGTRCHNRTSSPSGRCHIHQ